ncbi:hypothetical protein ILYODFUR_019302 [Ilyodon furcidens]|uniref:Aquaporin 7 n=1 Tax=Ilyodon furcidens TaxID=33524 RepID=A0ABV0UKG6_9TELE
MKDLVQSVELGVAQRSGVEKKRPTILLRSELSRVGLAEFLSTYVMMVFGTAMLLLCLMALSDQKNKPGTRGTEPIVVGLLVVLIGISLGSNSGYAINPTRDIAPRVFTAIAGWGSDVFRSGNGWWWVPLVATPIGGVLGAGVYKVFVEMQHPRFSGQDIETSEDESLPLKKERNICSDVCVKLETNGNS